MCAASDPFDITSTVRLIRRLRHRYVNYVQVAYGWLQLEESATALDYLAQCCTKLVSEGELMRDAPEAFALAMLEAGLDLEDRGVQLTYDFHFRDQGPNMQYPAELYELRYGRAVLRVLRALLERMKLGPGTRVVGQLIEPGSPDGTWRLRFRSSSTAASWVWSCAQDDPVISRVLAEFAELGYRIPFVAVDDECWTLDFPFEAAEWLC